MGTTDGVPNTVDSVAPATSAFVQNLVEGTFFEPIASSWQLGSTYDRLIVKCVKKEIEFGK